MSDAIIYHQLRTEMVNCQRLTMTGKIDSDGFDMLLNSAIALLKQKHEPRKVDLIFRKFESDIRLMYWLQRLESHRVGSSIATIIIFFTSEATLSRVDRNWNALASVIQELAEDEPKNMCN
jgi:hypothetical protein